MSNTDILIDSETGEMRFWNTTPDRWVRDIVGDPVPAEHPIRKAMEIGRAVLELEKDGYEYSRVQHGSCLRAMVEFRPVKPPALTGLDWLKSLPDGARRCNSYGGRFVKMPDGLHFVDKYVWTWTKIARYPLATWVNLASPETCPEWQPEEKSNV